VAKTSAIRTWGSGPAGAVAGAAHLARTLDIPQLLTLDVGGTSSDISLISEAGIDPSAIRSALAAGER
jgi:N-methylhydantoinase A